MNFPVKTGALASGCSNTRDDSRDACSKWLCCFLLCAVSISQAGCTHMNGTRHGALAGGTFGAVAGTLVGAATGNPKTGLVAGTVIGTALGASVGHADDVAVSRAVSLETSAQEAAFVHVHGRAMTEHDVLQMIHAGITDELIISTLADRRGHFQLSPAGIIELRNRGVSDRVIQAMQRYNLWR
ncbi:hypothetical protein Plim_2563 [Planctopirus limnophila DSM 3776]|uniref:Uncharacterized protein n=2 Tax=Planctopirus limnophila TaxID=120 RepID=D5SQ13_PLAL2|nr:hypothetical protein Plim_2563 [Planctopirus limnophila DSM 3776]